MSVSLVVKPDKAGIYWFQAIRPFIFGDITMCFSMELPQSEGEKVETFEPVIAVDFDKEGRP